MRRNGNRLPLLPNLLLDGEAQNSYLFPSCAEFASRPRWQTNNRESALDTIRPRYRDTRDNPQELGNSP
ncbi:hypothetical protein F2Q70_00002154 [Brassica cretica]|uniref:Uncharacterized protein n=1 Tax=Brassica cretica TaxID=69181 RepID=A0A8S9IVD3_BRACR|nr:hypothetical protein F2Q70_00002154 [Brassica cretica]